MFTSRLRQEKQELQDKLDELKQRHRSGEISRDRYLEEKHELLDGRFEEDVLQEYDERIEERQTVRNLTGVAAFVAVIALILVAVPGDLTGMTGFATVDNQTQPTLPIDENVTGNATLDYTFLNVTSLRASGAIHGQGETWIYLDTPDGRKLVYYSDTSGNGATGNVVNTNAQPVENTTIPVGNVTDSDTSGNGTAENTTDTTTSTGGSSKPTKNGTVTSDTNSTDNNSTATPASNATENITSNTTTAQPTSQTGNSTTSNSSNTTAINTTNSTSVNATTNTQVNTTENTSVETNTTAVNTTTTTTPTQTTANTTVNTTENTSVETNTTAVNTTTTTNVSFDNTTRNATFNNSNNRTTNGTEANTTEQTYQVTVDQSYLVGDTVSINVTPENATLYMHAPSDTYLLQGTNWTVAERGEHTVTALITDGNETIRKSDTFTGFTNVTSDTFSDICVETCTVEPSTVTLHVHTNGTRVSLENISYTDANTTENATNESEPVQINQSEENTSLGPREKMRKCLSDNPNRKPPSCFTDEQLDKRFPEENFTIYNALNTRMAVIDGQGDLHLRGSLRNATGQSPQEYDFAVKDNVWIDAVSGDLYLTGTVVENKETLMWESREDYVVNNNKGMYLGVFTADGDVLLRGDVQEESLNE